MRPTKSNLVTVWLVVGGSDVFIPVERVIDVWEAPGPAVCHPPGPAE